MVSSKKPVIHVDGDTEKLEPSSAVAGMETLCGTVDTSLPAS